MALVDVDEGCYAKSFVSWILSVILALRVWEACDVFCYSGEQSRGVWESRLGMERIESSCFLSLVGLVCACYLTTIEGQTCSECLYHART